jgi:putative membrane-bound dehydrogenase-like protein
MYSLFVTLLLAQPAFEPPPSKPLPPREEQMTFRVPKGFRVELVAAEPDVVDPVCFAFDEHGRLYVAEMPGYPNGGVGTGTPVTSGRIKRLEFDGDKVKSTLWADGLRFPTGVFPFKGGLVVANAPDILFLEDPENTGKATKKRVLYTGFDLANIQQLVNGFTWGFDNMIHAQAGSKGGRITCPEKPDFAVELRGRGVKFRPDKPGSLVPTSGGGQYGLTQNDYGDWFTNTNSQHLRHIVLPDHYLARNSALAVSQVTLDIPDHGAACQVFRISPFEAWRVERTRRRKDMTDRKFPTTELVPGGFVTSGCSPLCYLGGQFPKECEGDILSCDPANNLVHRDRLEPKGATYVAKRIDEGCEFMASTDNWFRPVFLGLGPDGCVYVADFYREVIETPLSLPDDMKAKLQLQSTGRGRIWRIVAEGPRTESVVRTPTELDALVAELGHANAWHRFTAHQRLVELHAKAATKWLLNTVRHSPTPMARVHALSVVDALKTIGSTDIATNLKHSDPRVRVQALRLAEMELNEAEVNEVFELLLKDPSSRVRFQLAFTLGADHTHERQLASMVARDGDDPWYQTALLSSPSTNVGPILKACLRDATALTRVSFIRRISQVVGASASDVDIRSVLQMMYFVGFPELQLAMLDGIGQGLGQRGRSLASLWEQLQPSTLRRELLASFERAAKEASQDAWPISERLIRVRIVGSGPADVALANLPKLWSAQQPQEIQLAAVRALAATGSPEVASRLLEAWPTFSPAVRREAQEILLARPDRAAKLLDAIAAGKIQVNQIEPARVEQLRKHPNAKLRERAVALLKSVETPDRRKVVEAYRPLLEKSGDFEKGRAVFRKNCVACHRLENTGNEVGAPLENVLGQKTPEQLLTDILDPSREVDPRYLQYVVTLTDGRTLTGLIAAETAGSVTLRRAEKQEDTILRKQIESIQSTAKSLMPEGLEMQIGAADFVDLLTYLQNVGRAPKKK